MTPLAEINHAKAVKLADMLDSVPGVEVLNDSFFNEFTVRLPGPSADIVDRLAERGVLAGVPAGRLFADRPNLADLMLVTATELTSEDDMKVLCDALREAI